ncbi:MAG: hypothetical protein WCR52_22455 [Bacteroidota bacterium]
MHILWIIGGITAGIAAFLLLSLIVQRLWNWLVPTKFKGPAIEFKHAAGMLILSRILLGGFGGHHGWNGPRNMAFHDGDRACRHQNYQPNTCQPTAPLPGDSTHIQH